MKPGTRLGPAPRLKKTSRPRPKRSDPHSPWQKLVDSRMRDVPITSRALADKISTANWKPAHTTIWAWTRCKDGYPPADTYTHDVNERLARALDLDPSVLAKAYEDSRRTLILANDSAATSGPLQVLRKLFASSQQTTWTKEELVEVIDQISGHKP